MFHIVGTITARILSGEIQHDHVMKKTTRAEAPPMAETIRYGGGSSLGSGAERRRNGGAGQAND